MREVKHGSSLTTYFLYYLRYGSHSNSGLQAASLNDLWKTEKRYRNTIWAFCHHVSSWILILRHHPAHHPINGGSIDLACSIGRVPNQDWSVHHLHWKVGTMCSLLLFTFVSWIFNSFVTFSHVCTCHELTLNNHLPSCQPWCACAYRIICAI